MLTKLKEDYLSLSAKVQGVMALSDGKPGAMPADDQVKFEQMLTDLDSLQHSIELAKKAEAHAKWAATPNDTLRVAPEVLQDVKLETVESKHAFAKWITGNSLNQSEQKALAHIHTLTGGSDIRGGVLVPSELSNDLIILLRNMMYIRTWAKSYVINSGSSIDIPVLTADVSDPVATSEAASSGTDDTQLNFGLRTLAPRLREITVPIGRLLEVTSALDIYSIVMESAAYARRLKEEKEFLLGNGSDAAMGLLVESPNGASTSRTVSGITANQINFDDYVNAVSSIRSQFRGNARWLIHRNTEGRTRKIKDANGNYVWSPTGAGVFNAQGLTVGFAPSILGFPYDTSENMADPGITGNITTGTMVAILADFNQAYGIADSIQSEVVNLDQKYYPRKALGFLSAYDGQVLNENALIRIKVS
jgi:HK97 family phage major capsid protein